MRPPAGVAVFAALAVGCGSADPRDSEPRQLLIAKVGIEPDVGIDVEPAIGAGLFVETTSAGEWTLITACDSEYSGYACDWDVVVSVSPGQRLSAVELWDDERTDGVFRIDSGALQWLTLTGGDLDGLTFEAPIGETVRVDALLDGASDPRFIFWNLDGAVQGGAPSDPVDMQPRLAD